MKGLKEYSVNLVNLNKPVHQFEYEIDDAFFALMESPLVQSGQLKVLVDMKNSTGSVTFDFNISGKVTLTCDICLEEFEYPLTASNRLVVKFGNEEKEISDEIIMVPEDTGTFHLASYIYEYIGMQIPYKKVHPKYLNEENTADEIFRFSTEPSEAEPEETQPVDPRWEILKNLKLN
ncbi:MAG: DUF177 domain-containing protein [Cytophagales bacterium]|nr:DUF177 domain-containing protein [Cytophagales bacterium]